MYQNRLQEIDELKAKILKFTRKFGIKSCLEEF